MTRPSDFPPPFSPEDFILEPTDPVDERIEVGVLIVGAGPAGLACAIRLGQLLDEHPDVAERLGDVPVAVVEKGKQPGSHLLWGAVVNPRALRRLFKDRYRLEDLPSYGPVHGEAVYVLTQRNSLRIPPPPTMRNHGNWIFSLSQLGRWLAERAEEGGAMVLPETAAEKLLVSHGRVVGLSADDLLQELETHPKIRKLLEGGERIGWGAKTIPSGGFYSLPKRLHAPGLLLCGDGVGMVNIPRLKGIHYAIESGRLAAESAFAALRRGATPATALASYDEAVKESFIYRDLNEVRDMRQVFGRGFFVGGALASAMTVSKGRLDLGKLRAEPDAEQPLIRTGRAAGYPAPDGKLTFDKLSSVFLSGNKTRDDQPNHIRSAHAVHRDGAENLVQRLPAQVVEVRG